MNYHWKKTPSGQYIDGHEHNDIKDYRQSVFLPKIEEIRPKLRTWHDGIEEAASKESSRQKTVLWFHDESIFYANDHREVRWVHKDETAKPKPKGEGISIMVSDFISADYGWLSAPDEMNVQVILKPGKGREGYFTNTQFLKQVCNAMSILKQHFPNEDHIFIFDNATTHLKRPDNALSARNMPKNPTSSFKITQTIVDDDGNIVYGANGQLMKEGIKMADGQLPDGSPQSFYFPEGHQLEGKFKGMARILEEQGYVNARGL